MILTRDFLTIYQRVAALTDVPPPPGSTPLSPDHVRLYHYTHLQKGMTEEQVVENLKQHGLDIKKAKGSSYGEPNVIWGSTQVPNRNHIFTEFAVHKDDPRWGIGRPRTTKDVEWLNKSGGDVTFQDSIRPEDFIAIHVPWHDTYRYLVEHDMVNDVVNGEYDYLLDKPDSKEAKAIQYIKDRRARITGS
jgi:hypothetical protein